MAGYLISPERMATLDIPFYDSNDSLAFGSVDGIPTALDHEVIAHELTHIVTLGQLGTSSAERAIGETLADTMAAAVSDDWVIIEIADELGLSRDMSTPRSMSDFDELADEHDNGEIGNHAAYLIGASVGRETMGRIYAHTIEHGLHEGMDFTDLARATYASAVALYGAGSAESSAVVQAWDSVLELDGDTTVVTTPGDAATT